MLILVHTLFHFTFSPKLNIYFFVLVLYSRQCHTQSWLAFTQFMGCVSVSIVKTPLHILFSVLKWSQLVMQTISFHFFWTDTGFVPLFVYAIFGSSRQLAVGPVALVSLLVSNVLGGIVNSSSELYTELAILLAFMVGILECLMGLLRWFCLPRKIRALVYFLCWKFEISNIEVGLYSEECLNMYTDLTLYHNSRTPKVETWK